MRLIFIINFLVFIGIKQTRLKRIIKNEHYLTLYCPRNFTINVVNISTLQNQLNLNKLISSFEEDLYNKCPSLLILLDSIKAHCNCQRICKNTHKLIQHSLKLCPDTDLYLKYECVDKIENSSQKAAEIHSALYCMNNHQLNVHEVSFLSSHSDPVEGKEAGCLHDSELKSLFAHQCHQKSHCVIYRTNFSTIIKRCNASNIRLALTCKVKPISDISRLYNSEGEAVHKSKYNLKCAPGKYIKAINTTGLEFGSKVSSFECENIKVFKKRLEVKCLSKNSCQIEDSLVDKLKKYCVHLHYIFVEYSCFYFSREVIKKVGCEEEQIIDVRLTVKNSLKDKLDLCVNAGKLLLSLEERCHARSVCELSMMETAWMRNDYCLSENNSIVEMECKNKDLVERVGERKIKVCHDENTQNGTFNTHDLIYFNDIVEKNETKTKNYSEMEVIDDILDTIFDEKRRRDERSVRKTDLVCSQVKTDELFGYKVTKMGHWDVHGRFSFDQKFPSYINPEENNLMISFERHFTPIVTMQRHEKQQRVRFLCESEGVCDFYIMKLPPHHIPHTPPPLNLSETENKPKEKSILFNILKNIHRRHKPGRFLKAIKMLSRKERSVENKTEHAKKKTKLKKKHNKHQIIRNITLSFVILVMTVLYIFFAMFFLEAGFFRNEKLEKEVVILPEEIYNYKCDYPITPSQTHLNTNQYNNYYNNYSNWGDHNNNKDIISPYLPTKRQVEKKEELKDISKNETCESYQNHFNKEINITDPSNGKSKLLPINRGLRRKEVLCEASEPFVRQKSNEKYEKKACYKEVSKTLDEILQKDVNKGNEVVTEERQEMHGGDVIKDTLAILKNENASIFQVHEAINKCNLNNFRSFLCVEDENEIEENAKDVVRVNDDLKREFKQLIVCERPLDTTSTNLSSKLLATSITYPEIETTQNVLELLGKTKQDILLKKKQIKDLSVEKTRAKIKSALKSVECTKESENKQGDGSVKGRNEMKIDRGRRIKRERPISEINEEKMLEWIAAMDKELGESVLNDLIESRDGSRVSSSATSDGSKEQSDCIRGVQESPSIYESSEASEQKSFIPIPLKRTLLQTESRSNLLSSKQLMESVVVSEIIVSTSPMRISQAKQPETLQSDFFSPNKQMDPSASLNSGLDDELAGLIDREELTEEIDHFEIKENEGLENVDFKKIAKILSGEDSLMDDPNKNLSDKNNSCLDNMDDELDESCCEIVGSNGMKYEDFSSFSKSSSGEEIESDVTIDIENCSYEQDSDCGKDENSIDENGLITASQHSFDVQEQTNNSHNTNCNNEANIFSPQGHFAGKWDSVFPRLKPPPRMVCPEGLLVKMEGEDEDNDVEDWDDTEDVIKEKKQIKEEDIKEDNLKKDKKSFFSLRNKSLKNTKKKGFFKRGKKILSKMIGIKKHSSKIMAEPLPDEWELLLQK